MLWKILPWLLVLIFVLVAIGIGYLLTAGIYGRKTSMKLSRQYWGLVLLFSISYVVVFYFLPENYKDILRTILFSGLSVFLIHLLIVQLKGSHRTRIEKPLLDLGLDPNSFFFLLLGAMSLSFALALMTISISNSRTTVLALSQFVFSVLLGVLGLYKGSSKTIFTEKGISSVSDYTEWSDIRSYEWEESKLPILQLKVTNSWITLNRVSINIAVSDKNAVEALLTEKLSKSEMTEGYETA